MGTIRSGLVLLPRRLWSAWPLARASLAVDALWEWRRRHRSRYQLRMMSDHMRKDIGISRADAWREGRKPFWKA
ncbi:MAG TPA: DUF1127 domain-containing protein [Dongiaceae bacterium]|nr:DUF1127 domain-containing protein [Dongiaceae bacterium]